MRIKHLALSAFSVGLAMILSLATSYTIAQDSNIIYKGKLSAFPSQPLVPIELDSIRFSCLVDTGAANTLIDDKFAPYLCQGLKEGPKIAYHNSGALGIIHAASGLSGRGSYRSFKNARINLGNATFTVECLGTWPSLLLNQSEKVGTIGIIGFDIISRQSMELNFSSDSIIICKTLPSECMANASEIPLLVQQDCPFIELDMLGKRERFLIDTGRTGAIEINRRLFDRLTTECNISQEKQASLHINGGRASLGSIFVDTPIALAENIPEKIFKSEYQYNDHSCAIGVGFMRYFDWGFDFPNKKAYVKPSKWFKYKDFSNAFGMSLGVFNGELEVLTIASNSIAAEKGVEAGDKLASLSVDGSEIKDKSHMLHHLRNLSGDSIIAKISRNGGIFEIILFEASKTTRQ